MENPWTDGFSRIRPRERETVAVNENAIVSDRRSGEMLPLGTILRPIVARLLASQADKATRQRG